MPGLAWIPWPLQPTKKVKNGALFLIDFKKKKKATLLCPNNLLPSSPRTLTRQRINRNTIGSLLSRAEWAATWISQKKFQSRVERSYFSGYPHAPPKMSNATATAAGLGSRACCRRSVYLEGSLCKPLGYPSSEGEFQHCFPPLSSVPALLFR